MLFLLVIQPKCRINRIIRTQLYNAYSVYCSETVLCQTEILASLSRDHFVSIIEREGIVPVDFIVSERCGIILVELISIDCVKQLVRSLTEVSLKYATIWIIVHTKATHGSKIVHNNFNIVQQLMLSTSNFSAEQLVVHIRFSFTNVDTSALIRQAIDFSFKEDALVHVSLHDAQASKHDANYVVIFYGLHAFQNYLPKIWWDRHFLLSEQTHHERFLALFPTINAFTAQVMLQKVS